MKKGERQCVQARKTKLNFREIKSNLNNTMGETLNAQRNQQENSNKKEKNNNNKYIAKAAVSATRATRTSSSISLLIYLYRNSFRPCPSPCAHSLFSRFFSRLSLTCCGLLLICQLSWIEWESSRAGRGEPEGGELEGELSQRRHQYYCHKFHICRP